MPDPFRYVYGDWNHQFTKGGPETALRLVFDLQKNALIFLRARAGQGWFDCSAQEIIAVEYSLKNVNEDALDHPRNWGLEGGMQIPPWARDAFAKEPPPEIVIAAPVADLVSPAPTIAPAQSATTVTGKGSRKLLHYAVTIEIRDWGQCRPEDVGEAITKAIESQRLTNKRDVTTSVDRVLVQLTGSEPVPVLSEPVAGR